MYYNKPKFLKVEVFRLIIIMLLININNYNVEDKIFPNQNMI